MSSAALAEVERLEAERRELTAELAGFGGASADPFAKRRLREVERELARAWERRRRELAGGGRGARPHEEPSRAEAVAEGMAARKAKD